MSKNIFIYEPYATGHHTGFLRTLLAAFEERPQWHTTLLTSNDARDHTAFKRLAEEFKGHLDIVVARHLRESTLVRCLVGRFYAEQRTNAISVAREFKALNRERHFDLALLPYMEAVGVHSLAFRSLFGSVPWAVIPHGVRFHFQESGIKAPVRRIDTLQRICFLRMLRIPTLAAVFSLDPYLVRWAKHPKVTYVPDPSPLPPALDPKACRRSLGLPEHATIILVYGAIDRRKCLDLLLPAVAEVDRAHNVLLVVAGVQDPRLRTTLLQEPAAIRLRQQSRLVEFDRFVTVQEEQMLFNGADVVWNYYRDQLGSSGVLVRAGQYSRPVITSDVGLSGRVVADEKCGIVISRPESIAVTLAITELAASSDVRKEMGRRAFARFSRNVPEAFAGPIRAAIEVSAPIRGMGSSN